MYRVLLLCKDNTVLSPMAEGYLKFFAGKAVEAFSAGINAKNIDPQVVELMREDGVDISGIKATNLSDLKSVDFDYILTFDGDSRDESLHLPSRPVKYHFDFCGMVPDGASAQEVMEAYRNIQVKIKKSLRTFVKDHFDLVKKDHE